MAQAQTFLSAQGQQTIWPFKNKNSLLHSLLCSPSLSKNGQQSERPDSLLSDSRHRPPIKPGRRLSPGEGGLPQFVPCQISQIFAWEQSRSCWSLTDDCEPCPVEAETAVLYCNEHTHETDLLSALMKTAACTHTLRPRLQANHEGD